MKNTLRFALICSLFVVTLARIDRFFFTHNHHFSTHFLFSNLKPDPTWELSPQTEDLDPILSQAFHYLGKGNRCIAYLSEDRNYVIKFHRFPTHMRIFSWITHPLSDYRKKRQKIKTLDTQKLKYNFQSYKDSFDHLKKETGLLYLHLNPTSTLHRTVTLIDASHARHRIPLDQVTFIVQHKAELIYPTLDRCITENKMEDAKAVISNILDLILSTCKKGYIHNDPVLHQNYGLLPDRAIYIDIGDLIKREGIEKPENYIPYIKEMTQGLRHYLKNKPDLLAHYLDKVTLDKTNK